MSYYSQSQKEATAKYNKKSYDDIKIRVKKGEKEKIKSYAQSLEKSINKYICDLIYEDMDKKHL